MKSVRESDNQLARLDEIVRRSPVGEGFAERGHFLDAAASMWISGELLHIEDLVFHDTHMDIRSPTHELVIGHGILRARRRIAGAEPGWAVSEAGISALTGAERATITMIMARRDKFYAHLDKRYFNDPKAIYADYPLTQMAVIALVNCVIDIIASHQRNLNDTVGFHVGEFYAIAIENMVRNLETGRRANFPGQLD